MDYSAVGRGSDFKTAQERRSKVTVPIDTSICPLALSHNEHLCTLVWRVEGEFVTTCTVACKEPVVVLENEYPSEAKYVSSI